MNIVGKAVRDDSQSTTQAHQLPGAALARALATLKKKVLITNINSVGAEGGEGGSARRDHDFPRFSRERRQQQGVSLQGALQQHHQARAKQQSHSSSLPFPGMAAGNGSSCRLSGELRILGCID